MSWRSASSQTWLRGLPGVREKEPLASRTSFGIGGPADFFLEPGKAEGIEKVLAGARDRGIPYFLLGAGTNLLIADAGIDGLVVRVATREHRVDGTRITAAAGLKMMRLARIAADANLRGFEFAIGVPGSVGGAVYQNAGCWGRELREVLVEACGFMPASGEKRWTPADLKGGFVVEATIELKRGDGEEAKAQMAQLTRERNEPQPIETTNCGSVFKNPPGDSAGRLVQAAGLKGAREGKAVVSPMHGNFIVNEGGATAADVKRLIERIQAEVRRRFNIDLEA